MNPLETKIKNAAVLTIYDAKKWTESDKKNVAKWLRKQAKDLIKNGHKYSKKCVARYRYSI